MTTQTVDAKEAKRREEATARIGVLREYLDTLALAVEGGQWATAEALMLGGMEDQREALYFLVSR